MTRYRCRWCGYVCDPARGEAQRATPPGTPHRGSAGRLALPRLPGAHVRLRSRGGGSGGRGRL